jgi:hypothetical protein
MMDHGNPSQHEDSNFNLYDTYGSGMDDDVADSTFPMGTWDHHQSVSEGLYPGASSSVDQHGEVGGGGGYDHNTSGIDGFDPTVYTQQFQQEQPFDPHVQQYPDFLGQEAMSDPHGNVVGGYDMNSMDLYTTPSIYPDLTQGNSGYGIQINSYLCSDFIRRQSYSCLYSSYTQ